MDLMPALAAPARHGRYAYPNEQRLRGVYGQRMVVAIAMLDLVGFSTLIERDPEGHAPEMAPDADLVHRAGHQAIPGDCFQAAGRRPARVFSVCPRGARLPDRDAAGLRQPAPGLFADTPDAGGDQLGRGRDTGRRPSGRCRQRRLPAAGACRCRRHPRFGRRGARAGRQAERRADGGRGRPRVEGDRPPRPRIQRLRAAGLFVPVGEAVDRRAAIRRERCAGRGLLRRRHRGRHRQRAGGVPRAVRRVAQLHARVSRRRRGPAQGPARARGPLRALPAPCAGPASGSASRPS